MVGTREKRQHITYYKIIMSSSVRLIGFAQPHDWFNYDYLIGHKANGCKWSPYELPSHFWHRQMIRPLSSMPVASLLFSWAWLFAMYEIVNPTSLPRSLHQSCFYYPPISIFCGKLFTLEIKPRCHSMESAILPGRYTFISFTRSGTTLTPVCRIPFIILKRSHWFIMIKFSFTILINFIY